jgi:hypothetical protein
LELKLEDPVQELKRDDQWHEVTKSKGRRTGVNREFVQEKQVEPGSKKPKDKPYGHFVEDFFSIPR